MEARFPRRFDGIRAELRQHVVGMSTEYMDAS
jgi:hypothetical protein